MHNHLVGRFGEDLAKKYLEQKGYRIIDRNVKLSYKELDLVARHQEKIIFIEVKTRISKYNFGSAEDNMSKKKLHHLKKAIGMYTSNHHLNPNLVRLDLLAIDLNKKNKSARIRHYRDLF